MINLEITSFAKILCKGLKQYLKNENIKINDVDFQELENKLISEFNLPYSDQTQTPTQLLNNFSKTSQGHRPRLCFWLSLRKIFKSTSMLFQVCNAHCA